MKWNRPRGFKSYYDRKHYNGAAKTFKKIAKKKARANARAAIQNHRVEDVLPYKKVFTWRWW